MEIATRRNGDRKEVFEAIEKIKPLIEPEVYEKIKDRLTRMGESMLWCGLPEGPKARHICSDCGRKKYEEAMQTRGYFKDNNFKSWLKWSCRDCHSGRKQVKA